jgi:hypothetical protein
LTSYNAALTKRAAHGAPVHDQRASVEARNRLRALFEPGRELRRRRLEYELQESQVDEILNAVGRQFVPRWINRRRLRQDIDWCLTVWQTEHLTSPASARTLVDQLGKIARTAKNLRGLFPTETKTPAVEDHLESPLDLLMRRIATEYSLQRSSFSAFLADLDWFANEMPRLAEKMKSADAPRLNTNVINYLCGKKLPAIFKKHFKKKPGMGRGPYPRFACAVLNSLGITHNGKPYSMGTVTQALASVGGFSYSDK